FSRVDHSQRLGAPGAVGLLDVVEQVVDCNILNRVASDHGGRVGVAVGALVPVTVDANLNRVVLGTGSFDLALYDVSLGVNDLIAVVVVGDDCVIIRSDILVEGDVCQIRAVVISKTMEALIAIRFANQRLGGDVLAADVANL